MDGTWIFAIFTQRLKLDVEVDGEQHRSATGGRVQDDIDRDQALVANGWQVYDYGSTSCVKNRNGVFRKSKRFTPQICDYNGGFHSLSAPKVRFTNGVRLPSEPDHIRTRIRFSN